MKRPRDAADGKTKVATGGKTARNENSTRCSPSAFSKMIRALSNAQKKLIRKAGFQGLLDFKPRGLDREYIAWLLEYFDPVTMTIKNNGQTIFLNESGASSVFGLRNEGDNTPSYSESQGIALRDKLVELVHEKARMDVRNSTGGISPSQLADAIARCNFEEDYDAIEDEQVVRMFYMVAINTILSPDTSSVLRGKDIIWAESFEKINWCKVVVESLKGLTWKKEKGKYISGSVIFLLIVYLDHLQCNDVDLMLKPRCKYYEYSTILKLTALDTSEEGKHGIIKLRPTSETCYEPNEQQPTTRSIQPHSEFGPHESLEIMLAQAVIEANKLGKSTQVSAVLEEFAEKKEAADDYIRVGKEKSKAAYWKAIQSLQSITLGPIHYDSDDDLYDNYFIKKVIPIPADGYRILDFPDSYVESEFFFKCFQPEGEMHSLILDLKCYLLNKNWHDKVILYQKTVTCLKEGTQTNCPEISEDNMNDIKLIFIPLNIANVHWILVVVDTEKGSVQICDSMRSTAVTEREETVNHVLQELEKNLKSKWKISTFECTMMEVSQQGNGFDCGFRVLMSIEGYGDDIYHFTEENTFEYRRKLFKELYFHEENRAVHPKHSNEKHDYDRENGEEEQDKASKPEKTKAGQNKTRRKTAKTVATAKGDREADHGIGLRSIAKKVNYTELASGDDPAQAKKKGRGGSSASTKKNGRGRKRKS